MRPTQSLKLPQSGVTIEFVTYWSWGEKQEITKTILGDTTIDPQNGTVGDINASNGLDLNRKALELAVTKITSEDGTLMPNSELFDLPEADIELLLLEIKKFDDKLKKN